ncbi:MAG: FecR domain-containing protein [Desulfosarcina sp.]
MKTIGLAIIATIFAATSGWAAQASVGSIKTMEGSVVIIRQGTSLAAAPGHPIFEDDTIQTQADSRVGIVLRDDTTLSLGPRSTLELKTYLFQPDKQRFSLVVHMAKGTFAYLSGVMGKLAPDAIRLETPDSVIGIRGTHLLIEVKGS